jgi:dihydrofolate reductase
MIQGRRIGVFAAMSLDGYLAGKDDNLDFLAGVQDPEEDYGYGAFANRVVGYVVGRRTFEVVQELCDGEFPHVGRWPIYVVTNQAAAMPDTEGVEFGTLEELPVWLGQRVAPTEGDEVVWCDGGGQVISALSEHIDEWTLSVVPALLGDGIRLFPGGRPPVSLSCSGAMSYSRGLVQMRYVKAQG